MVHAFLTLFGILMVVIGVMMLGQRKSGDNPDIKLTFETMPQMLPMLAGIGLAVGALSGFFGIGRRFPDCTRPNRRDRYGR